MKKERGGISILLMFVFLVVSLLLLYLVSVLDLRINLSEGMFDGAQSSYIAESLALLAFEEKLEGGQVASRSFEKGDQDLGSAEFSGIESTSLQFIRRPGNKQSLSTFILKAQANYEKIQSQAELVGDLVNPIFYQEDGILEASEISEAKEAGQIMAALSSEFYQGNQYIDGRVLQVDRPSLARAELKTLYLETIPELVMEGEEISFGQDLDQERVRPEEINLIYKNVLRINSQLELQNLTDFHGILILGQSCQLYLEDKLRLRGVLLVETGSQVEGYIEVEGLTICLDKKGPWIKSQLNCRVMEYFLYRMGGFVQPEVKRVKKLVL